MSDAFIDVMTTPITQIGVGSADEKRLCRIARRKIVADLPLLLPSGEHLTMNGVLRPEYPVATKAMPSARFAKLAIEVLWQAGPPAEWLSPALVQRYQLPAFHQALVAIHQPVVRGAGDPRSLFRLRLALDELVAQQLRLLKARSSRNQDKVPPIVITPGAWSDLINSLSFTLTTGQAQAVSDVVADLARTDPMSRLIQGDVGAGKTAIAQLVAAGVAMAGGQVALMAPTVVLAAQLYEKVAPWLAAHGLTCRLLAAGERPAAKRATLAGLAEGTIQVAVGTHALITEGVRWCNLALAIIDEQHRFGVRQRTRLTAGRHAMMMTATPIPRALLQVLHGDLDISLLPDKPPGRIRVATATVDASELGAVAERVSDTIARGESVFWVTPAIQENLDEFGVPTHGMITCVERYAHLLERFGDSVGIAHGDLSPAERREALRRLRDREIAVLVATSVIEVGVDVSHATLIVIEDAQRFGLAQLHQLRGRVGRSALPSSCLLMANLQGLSEEAAIRLDAMTRHDDGAELARIDKELRGGGDLIGEAQSGGTEFATVAEVHLDWIHVAQAEAKRLLAAGPGRATDHLMAAFGPVGQDDAQIVRS
jgi:ATP-dependent DNA helicase RecG